MKQAFNNANALLDFLESDEPERYVFRGQTRAYEGPMLPSGIRDRFTPFDSSGKPNKWAGVTIPLSELQEKHITQFEKSSPVTETLEFVDYNKTIWDLPESSYQKGFCDFFNQPARFQHGILGNLLRESAIPAMAALIGNNLADLLCQQYGFTSTALDVSTDPSVAMFFATHQAPFYNLVNNFSHLGIIYRWPRERAIIARNLMLPLEGSNFESITTSFFNFIKESPDLVVVQDTLERCATATGKRVRQRMWIVSQGNGRDFDSLRFPTGTFDRSRMGRQRAGILLPDYEVVTPLMPGSNMDQAALIGDLLKTHQGEFFDFHHIADADLAKQLNKFDLWSSIKAVTEYKASDFQLELQHNQIIFEDLYLEMLLRFFSSCSPCDIIMEKMLEPGNHQSLLAIGPVNGVVDLGYLMLTADADLLAKRLKDRGAYTPIPTLRYIPEEQVASFKTAFAKAIVI